MPTASLRVDYECAQIERALVLEHLFTLRQGKDSSIDILRLMPVVSATLYPSIGAASIDPGEEVFQFTEFVQFSGSKRAGLKYPLAWSATASPFFGQFSGASPCPSVSGGGSVSHEIITAFDSEGNSARPDIRYDRDANELVADEAITGIVSARYSPSYRVVRVVRGRDQMNQEGNIIAIYQGVMAEAGLGRTSPEEPAHVYAVVSEYVADEQGAWEVPPGWDEDNTYPIRRDEPLPSKDSYQQLERVHESCFMDYDGLMRFEKYIVRWEEPYAFPYPQANYNPKYFLDRGDNPGGKWTEAWLAIDWASIEADVSERYPGIQL